MTTAGRGDSNGPRAFLPLESSTVFVLAMVMPILIVGCNSRPRAPALVTDSVYQNDQEGFRFEVPDGWIIHAKTTLPSGVPVTKEKMLVAYRRPHPKRMAVMEVACVDLPEDADLTLQLIGKRTDADAWKQSAQPDAASVGDLPGKRFYFSKMGRDYQLNKEVVAVRRGGRFYFFVLVATPEDLTARDEIRRVIAGVTWKPM
jgi:hypothetical protein